MSLGELLFNNSSALILLINQDTAYAEKKSLIGKVGPLIFMIMLLETFLKRTKQELFADLFYWTGRARVYGISHWSEICGVRTWRQRHGLLERPLWC